MDDHSDHDHGQDEHGHDEHDNEVQQASTGGLTGLTVRQLHIVALTTLPLLAAIGICCSIFLSRYKNSIALVCSTVFAGGLLIATGLTAILPEAEAIYSHLRHDGQEIAGDFPLSYTLFGASFIFLIFIDTLADRWSENLEAKQDNAVDKTTKEGENEIKKGDQSSVDNQGFSMKEDVEEQTEIHGHCHAHTIPESAKPWTGVLLTLIISIHSILECIVIGSITDVHVLTSSYIAVAVHKIFDGFALGSGLVASGYWTKQRRKFIYISAFYVILNLISVGIGMAVSTAFSHDSAVIATLLSLVAGSFLYVGVIELIPGELEKMRSLKMPVLPVMLSLSAGFVAMTLVSKFAHAGHDDH